MSESELPIEEMKTTMLDDTKTITAIDKAHMLDVLAQFPNQIREAITLTNTMERINIMKIDNVIIAGMGASAISGDIIASLFRDRVDVPVYVNREYDLPKWANKDTLIIFISYSGNTEETLSALKIASQKKCKIICISSGGKLQELAESRQIPYLKIPSNIQPRAATAFLLFPCLLILKRTGLLKTNIEAEIEETITVIQDLINVTSQTVPEATNPAKQLAKKLFGTIPQIYGWSAYVPIATRWRHQFNENSKVIARNDVVPENNHNDIVGWSANPEISKLFSCILFRDKEEESVQMSKRLNFMKNLFENTAAKTIEVSPKGKSLLAKMMYIMCLGDITSCYLAVLRGIDPSPVDIIKELKNRLAE